MSEPQEGVPTNHDLHVAVELQGQRLERIENGVQDIKELLVGDGKGLVFDVDRLKRSSATIKAIVWVLFTTLLGAGATIAVASIVGK